MYFSYLIYNIVDIFIEYIHTQPFKVNRPQLSLSGIRYQPIRVMK